MKFSTRSTEEIFSNFITLAFIKDSATNMVKLFQKHYWECENQDCHPEVSFLSLILMMGTLWLGVTLFDFKKTPFLSARKREILSDYALPVAVVVFSLIGKKINTFYRIFSTFFFFLSKGSQLFSNTKLPDFPFKDEGNPFKLVNFSSLSVGHIFGAMALGFSLSLLFFMDQNISAAMVDSPDNKLVKGNAYHWDLLVIGLINAILCIFGLPFMHAVLPHSPLHVKCLADTEEHVESGHVKSIVVYVRETRLTNIFSKNLAFQRDTLN